MQPSVVLEKLRQSMELFEELVDALPETALAAKLPGLRSNRIGQQLWCVVGARESYARALEAGAWAGFDCSMTAEECVSAPGAVQALKRSRDTVERSLVTSRDWSPSQSGIVLSLLEHEAAHQGQLIRYLYALELPIPPGWKSRYALQ